MRHVATRMAVNSVSGLLVSLLKWYLMVPAGKTSRPSVKTGADGHGAKTEERTSVGAALTWIGIGGRLCGIGPASSTHKESLCSSASPLIKEHKTFMFLGESL
jgi:hypothetical protein